MPNRQRSTDINQILSDIRELADQNDGEVKFSRTGWGLDPSDERDAPLIASFAEVNLPPKPENWRALAEAYAIARHSKKGGRAGVGEKLKTELISDAYECALQMGAGHDLVSLPRICEELAKGSKNYRAPAEYRDPQGPLHPKTLQNRLEKSLAEWERNKDRPDTQSNYEYVPHLFDEMCKMVDYLRRLARPV